MTTQDKLICCQNCGTVFNKNYLYLHWVKYDSNCIEDGDIYMCPVCEVYGKEEKVYKKLT